MERNFTFGIYIRHYRDEKQMMIWLIFSLVFLLGLLFSLIVFFIFLAVKSLQQLRRLGQALEGLRLYKIRVKEHN